ncbi:MAG: MraY family glycosyltransferase [Gemmataceae bacterium]
MSERGRLLVDMLLLFCSSLVVSLVLTPVIRAIARCAGLVDRPDGRRKMHTQAVPVAGGVSVFISTATVLLYAIGQLTEWRQALVGNGAIFGSLLAACSVIVLVGIIDDAWGMRGRSKLVGQMIAVAIVIFGGVRVEGITLFDVPFHWGYGSSIAITALWLLLAINSLNLLDGMDGLLGSIGTILCLTIGALAFLTGHVAAGCVSMALAGALVGFLWYNFPPATIFMGDAGSMLIGLVVGTLAIHASLKGATVGLAVIPVALMTVPLLDTAAAIVRRRLTGRSIYTTDRGHLHHMLTGRGLSNWQVLAVIVVLCLAVAAGAIVSQARKNELFAIVPFIGVIGFLVAFKLFGHSEFQLIKQRFAAMVHNVRGGHETGDVHEIKVHLQGSGNWEEIWHELTAAADDMKLKTVCLDVNAPAIHEGYHARWERAQKGTTESSGYWRVEIPLSLRGATIGRLEVLGLRNGDSAGQKLAALAKMVEDLELAITEMTSAQLV